MGTEKKLYDASKVSPEQMMEDFFESEEKAKLQAKLDEGFEIAGVFDANTTDEEFEAMMAPFLDKME